jgi:hypothetical protein
MSGMKMNVAIPSGGTAISASRGAPATVSQPLIVEGENFIRLPASLTRVGRVGEKAYKAARA